MPSVIALDELLAGLTLFRTFPRSAESEIPQTRTELHRSPDGSCWAEVAWVVYDEVRDREAPL